MDNWRGYRGGPRPRGRGFSSDRGSFHHYSDNQYNQGEMHAGTEVYQDRFSTMADKNMVPPPFFNRPEPPLPGMIGVPNYPPPPIRPTQHSTVPPVSQSGLPQYHEGMNTFRQHPHFMNPPNSPVIRPPSQVSLPILTPPPLPPVINTNYPPPESVPQNMKSIHQDTAASNTGFNSSNVEENDHKVDDVKWIANWSSRIFPKPKSSISTKKSMSVPVARKLMRESISLRNSLHNVFKEVEAGLMEDKDIEMVMKIVTNIQKRLLEIRNVLHQDCLQSLCQKLEKSKKKRKRLRLIHQRKYAEKKETLLQQEIKKIELDEWKILIQRKMDEQKKEKEVSAEADRILATVRKKLSDMNRGQQLLKALHRLRTVRLEHAQSRGQIIPHEIEENYSDRMSHLVSLLQKQEETYKEEEKALQVMLEVEQEEEKQRQCQLEERRIHSRAKSYANKLEIYLFGPQEYDANLEGYRQYYNQAEQSVESLIEIRKEWDMYCVPEATMGSHLPINWVLPSSPSSTVWASALHKPDK